MQFDEFIKRVQEQARLDAQEDAETIVRAVLETLGERLDRKVRNGVLAQLPNELKDYLMMRADAEDQYTAEEFYNRVGARASLTFQTATERTRQVLSVLQDSIAEGETRQILESLPGEYAELFRE
jgi:uncharacterized protein (DUF2267 family)